MTENNIEKSLEILDKHLDECLEGEADGGIQELERTDEILEALGMVKTHNHTLLDSVKEKLRAYRERLFSYMQPEACPVDLNDSMAHYRMISSMQED